ncbi:MAG: CBS domain-containing protein [Nanoarchaeota archaeon]|nr:CBS domain-containing protein [Nanoarchaeota archaeon]
MVKVKEIMRQYVVTVGPDITADAAAKIMSNNRIGSVVISKNDVPIGIFTTEDVVRLVAQGDDPKNVLVGDQPRKEFITADPDEDLLKVTRLMLKHGIKRIPIVRNNQIQGIITDKELLITAPELIEVLSEKLKARAERVVQPHATISGICEQCEQYSDGLKNVNGRWACNACRT